MQLKPKEFQRSFAKVRRSSVCSQRTQNDSSRTGSIDPKIQVSECSSLGQCTDDDQKQSSSDSGISDRNNFSSSGSEKISFKRKKIHTEHPHSRKKRWQKTAEILHKSGLMDITLKTAMLIRSNQELQHEIEGLRLQTEKFVKSVLQNPENQCLLGNLESPAQLYEVVVPGSETLMDVISDPNWVTDSNFPPGGDSQLDSSAYDSSDEGVRTQLC